MKFLKKAPFEARIRQRFPDAPGGWLYNGLEQAFGSEAYTISARAKLDTLISKTQRLVPELHSSYPLYAFPDLAAGWRGLARSRRNSPIELPNAGELSQLIRKHIYFRDPDRYEDNYHITDADLRWIVIFCHHGDWHFFGPPQLVAKAKEA